MKYLIIEANTPQALETAVNTALTANPTFSPLGGPVFVSVSLYVQAIGLLV